MSTTKHSPVTDWTTDWDVMDPAWLENPYRIWDELRRSCPVAHTTRYYGAYMPTRYADIRDIAYDPANFSSRSVLLRDKPEPDRGGGPPITSDPPRHRVARLALLPPFTPDKVAALEPITRAYCHQLIDAFSARGRCDGALEYSQHIPVMVIAAMLGIPAADGDLFRGWVSAIFHDGIQDETARQAGLDGMTAYFREHLAARRRAPGGDLISVLINARHPDGRPFSENHILGSLRVLMLGGIDTTWSAIGSALWHLATNDDDRERLLREPTLVPTAIEEFLRAYAPVTMAREIVADTTVNGCTYRKGETVLMTYPAACRDPAVFEKADKVVIDRAENRHIAFGIGIHRCIGSNLARMEMAVAVDTFLKRIQHFRLDGPVAWSSGTTRGPRRLPLAFGGSSVSRHPPSIDN